MTQQVADCGHVPAVGTGMTETPSGQHICHACADNAIRELMRTGGPIVAYTDAQLSRITSWSGGTLATVIYVGKLNRRTGRHYITAQDIEGRMWHGQAASGMALTLRRLMAP